MKREQQLDAVLDEIFTRWGMTGMATGIVRAGGIAYQRCLGVQSLDTGVPTSADSIFCIASIGKHFVACAVMQLVEQGRLELDAPLVRYLPYFKLDDPRSDQMTISQVISHTAGMPDFGEIEYLELVAHPETDAGAPERFVRSLANRKAIGAPGERFVYSNIGYNVLGALLTQVGGQPFEDLIHEALFLPAGMPESTFLPLGLPAERLALPHVRTPEMIVNPIYPYHRADSPASFMHTTLNEMCHWALASLQRGEYAGRRFLKPETYDLMWSPVAERSSDPFRLQMGLGWSLGTFEGARVTGHGGGGFGWTCYFAVLPDNESGVIVLANEESSAHDLALRAAIRAVLDLEPQAGDVSLVIPVGEAYQAGGMPAARAVIERWKAGGMPGHSFDAYELPSLVYQVLGVGKVDAGIELLTLNLEAFPAEIISHVRLAELHLQRGERDEARRLLLIAQALRPESITVKSLMEQAGEA